MHRYLIFPFLTASLLFALPACDSPITEKDDTGPFDVDEDTAADECDDTDAASTVVAEDADCDGVLTADDCDDTDAASTVVAEDADCDGVLTADDCDDTAATGSALGAVAEDADCDGVITADDCDDTTATSTVVAEDGDCDGSLTGDDCDDGDAALNPLDVDGDGLSSCDGDCDDSDPLVNPNAPEVWPNGVDDDCDGIVDFTIQPGDWSLNNTVFLTDTCNVDNVSAITEITLDRGAEIVAQDDGLAFTDDGSVFYDQSLTSDCFFDGSQFNCTATVETLQLPDFEAEFVVGYSAFIVENSSTSLTATVTHSLNSCSGDDCSVIGFFLPIPCSYTTESAGQKD